MSNQPESPYEAPTTQIDPQAAGPDPRGSRWAGFGLYWLISVGGGFASMFAAGLLSRLFWSPGALYLLATAAPWLAILILGIWFLGKGKSRTAQGLLFGFLSQIGLAVLFVAACFGIIAMNGGLGGMH